MVWIVLPIDKNEQASLQEIFKMIIDDNDRLLNAPVRWQERRRLDPRASQSIFSENVNVMNVSSVFVTDKR